MSRFTAPEKWSDPWFSELSPEEKLVFLNLCDTVNCAGFIEVNARKIAWDTGISPESVKSAIERICAPRPSEDGEKQSAILHRGWIWLPNFLRVQKNFPINPRNRAHYPIISAIRDQAIRFRGVPAFVELKTQMEETVEKIGDPEAAPAGRVSRDDLKRVPKDWAAIREKCLASLNPNFRHDDRLRERVMAWWDHRMNLGDPLELPMWSEFQSMASQYAPRVTIEAITYAIANGLKTLNFAMAKRLIDESGQSTAPEAPKKSLPEPKEWESVFRQAFPDAPVPTSFWRIPENRRPHLFVVAPSLKDEVEAILNNQ